MNGGLIIVRRGLVLSAFWVLLLSSCGSSEAPSDRILVERFLANRNLYEDAADKFITSGYERIDRGRDGKLFVNAIPSNPEVSTAYSGIMKALEVEIIEKLAVENRTGGVGFIYYRTGIAPSGGCVKGIARLLDSKAIASSEKFDGECRQSPYENKSSQPRLETQLKQIESNWYVFVSRYR